MSGKVLELSDPESDTEVGELDVSGLSAALPTDPVEEVKYEPLAFPEARRAELKKVFDSACEAGKLDSKQVRARARGLLSSATRAGRAALRRCGVGAGVGVEMVAPARPPDRPQTYKIMFSKDERAEYGFADFELDLFATCEGSEESGMLVV